MRELFALDRTLPEVGDTQPMPPWAPLARLSPGQSNRTILLVEDHPAQREAIRRVLVEKSFKVVVATDLRGAIKSSEDHFPALLCLDMTLPRESGLELCERIRKDPRFRSVPILMIGDRAAPEDMANAEEAGANAFLKKPFTPDRLASCVTALLHRVHGDPRVLPPAAEPRHLRRISA